MSDILRLQPIVRDYAWGNDYFIADLLGLEKDGPRAELWMGAHRQGSSIVSGTGEKLCDFIDRNPRFAAIHDADDFPYLLKVLAIAQSLSIQCHPDARQAKAGFEGQDRSVARIDWNYQDPNPKAEMLYALTPVTAMCGFRTIEDSLKLMKIAAPALLKDHFSEVGTIYELFDGLYRLDREELSYGEAELLGNSDSLPDEVKAIVKDLGDRHFGDPGVFAPLLLNVIRLEPGQAIYLKPRVLHAYIGGNGVELMNNSDNVLRAGLTSKHMDLDELERVMIHEPYIPSPMQAVVDAGGTHFVCEGGFTLTAMIGGSFRSDMCGPRILLCTDGEATLNGKMTLGKGQCCIVGDSCRSISVDAGNASVFMASSNLLGVN